MKKIAAVNDLSGFGKCSLTAAIPVISAMGIQACPLPTAILSNQTGYGSYYIDDYTAHMTDYAAQWRKMGAKFDGICTGFLANEAQVEAIMQFLQDFRTEETVLVVDPVLGDNGKKYDNFSEKLCSEMRRLSFCADIITPNLSEACILCDRDYGEFAPLPDGSAPLDKIEKLGRELIERGAGTAVITGISSNESVINTVVSKSGCTHISSPFHAGSFSGTGDIFSAIICAGAVKGLTTVESTKKAAAFIGAAAEDTVKSGFTDRNDGINFEKFLYLLCDKGE